MNCPGCGSANVNVLDSRPTAEVGRRRRYLCHQRGERSTTVEIYAGTAPDSRREAALARALERIRDYADQMLGGKNHE